MLPIGMLLHQESWEIVGLLAVLVTLVGIWLQWHRNEHISAVEEDLKNAKITEEQAWHRMRLVNWRATVVVAAGLVLLLGTAIGLFA